jgi:hypothetical protein
MFGAIGSLSLESVAAAKRFPVLHFKPIFRISSATLPLPRLTPRLSESAPIVRLPAAPQWLA